MSHGWPALTDATPGEACSPDLYRLLVSGALDYAIFALDPTGHVMSWNLGAERIKGYAAHEIVGRHFSTFYPRGAIAAGYPQCELEVAAREGRFEDEGWRIRKDGSRFWANVVITALREADGRLIGFAKVTRDLTARRAAEEQARRLAAEEAARAEADAAIRARDELMGLISHDLRNPLTVVRGHLQLLRRRAGRAASLDSAELLRSLETVEASVMSLASQIDELQDATRLQAGRPLELNLRATDLVEVARAAVLRHQHVSDRHRLRFETSVPSLVGSWDAGRLERVLGNLLSNAIKYSPEGGDVDVTLSDDGGWAELAVEDHGLGIPAKDLPSVFERFRRAGNVVGRISGSGLGLAGARDIVQQHGGTIQVQSVEGRGSTFVVRLLVVAVDAPASQDEA